MSISLYINIITSSNFWDNILNHISVWVFSSWKYFQPMIYEMGITIMPSNGQNSTTISLKEI